MDFETYVVFFYSQIIAHITFIL